MTTPACVLSWPWSVLHPDGLLLAYVGLAILSVTAYREVDMPWTASVAGVGSLVPLYLFGRLTWPSCGLSEWDIVLVLAAGLMLASAVVLDVSSRSARAS